MGTNRFIEKHLTRRECKITALKALAAEWLATFEALIRDGYPLDEHTHVDFDGKTSDMLYEELASLNESLLTKAAKLEFPTKKTEVKRSYFVVLNCVKYDEFEIRLETPQGSKLINSLIDNDGNHAVKIYEELCEQLKKEMEGK